MNSEGGTPRLRDGWTVTTHDWSRDVDTVHLEEAARAARDLGGAMALHLVLEVLAHADDEATSTGRQGRVTITLRGPDVEIADRRSHECGREPWGHMYLDGDGEHWAGVTRFIEEHQRAWSDALGAGRRRRRAR